MHLQQQHADLGCDQCHDRFFTLNLIEEHREEMCVYRRLSCELPGCAAVLCRTVEDDVVYCMFAIGDVVRDAKTLCE